MKRFIFLCLLMATISYVQAQNITRVEYAIDTDPGFSLATPVSITPGSNITQTTTLNFTGLSDGVHVLFIRAMDDSSRWGSTIVKIIYVDTFIPHNTIMAEYFIDTDPGFGNGYTINLTPGLQPIKVFPINLSGIAMGLHLLYIRVKDMDNQWSITNSKLFFCDGNTFGNITQIEYFFDNDPGFGNGITISITPGKQVSKLFDVNTAGLSGGMHRVYIRTRDENGNWSQTESQWFTIVDMKVYIEGLYEPGSGEMRKAQDEAGDHFTDFTSDVLTVKALETTSPYNIVGTTNEVLLNQNGTFQPVMNRIPEGDYYLAVSHRNSIETWTANYQHLGTAPISYDFTDAANKAYGNNLKNVSGAFVIYGGDVNQDGFVDSGDMTPVDNDAANFVMGYFPSDVNGDGFVDSADMTIIDNNAANFVSAMFP